MYELRPWARLPQAVRIPRPCDHGLRSPLWSAVGTRFLHTDVPCKAGFRLIMSALKAKFSGSKSGLSPRSCEGKDMLVARRPGLLPGLLCVLLSVLAHGASAEDTVFDHVEVFGRISTESRLYPQSAAHAGQRSHASGVAVETTVYAEDFEGRSVTITPYFRYDAGDPERTHADLREAYLLVFGDVGDDQWELRLGVDQVFWGVVESRSLVDIINQTDLVEHPDEKTKLGQPMVHATLAGDWGALEFFGMTGHRRRTFPGRHGRLRSEFVVDDSLTRYESGAEEWHLEFAGRYSGNFGPLDVGLSVFDGTSREPTLEPQPALRRADIKLAPYYEKIRQFGLDAQVTTGPWLFKLEAIHRSGLQNVLREEEDYVAFIAGGEYTLYGVWDSDADLSLIAEWARDGRGRWATNGFENDLLLAARLGLNDEQNTEFSVSLLGSLAYNSRILNADFKRRLTDNWSLHVESFAYLEIDDGYSVRMPPPLRRDIIYPVRRDSFLGVNLDYHF